MLFFEDSEIAKVLGRLFDMQRERNNFIKLGILIALLHGLRIGEVCGLCWEDIDFENKYLYVRRTVSYRQNPVTKKICNVDTLS